MDIESIIKKLEFENKVSAFLRFMQTKTGIEVAEYATHLQDTIDGLTESKEEFVIAYKELLDKNNELRGLLINLLINESKDSDSLIQEWVGATIIKIKSAIPGAAGNSSATPAQQTLCDASLNAEDGTAQS